MTDQIIIVSGGIPRAIKDVTSNSKILTHPNLNAASSAVFEHGFKEELSDLSISLYTYDETSGEMIRIVKGGTPDLADFTIVATPGSTTTKITVTNGTATQQDLAVLISRGDYAEYLDQLDDVALATLADGDALVYEAATKLWKNKLIVGAKGDKGDTGDTGPASEPPVFYSELTYDVNGRVEAVDTWTTSAKTLKLFNKQFTYSSGAGLLTEVTITRISDSSQTVKTLSYSSGGVLEMITKTVV